MTQVATHEGHTHHKHAEDLLTVHEVAQRLRIDDTTVRRWVKNGSLEAISLPHQGKRQAYRIKSSTFNNILNNSVATVNA